jgi:hypothetical protein
MSAFATRQKVDASALNRTSELYNKILTLARNALIVAMDEAGEATGTTSSKYSTLQLCFVRPVPITERIGKFRVHMLPLSPSTFVICRLMRTRRAFRSFWPIRTPGHR